MHGEGSVLPARRRRERSRAVPDGSPIRALVDAGQADELLDLLPQLTEEQRGMGRVRLAEVFAWHRTGEHERTRDILLSGIVLPTIREGEVLLTDLWFSIQEHLVSKAEGSPMDETLKARVRRECPPPREIDFRMKV